MIKFLNKYKIIFYLINFCIFFLYLFPGSIYGCVFLDDCSVQPQITADLPLISSNHLYAFFVLSVIGYLTYIKKKHINYLIIYLLLISIILEILHLVIPERSFQWSDLFGNLLAVIIVFSIYNLIKKYEKFKK